MFEITCETKDTLKIEELEAFQGGLKARDSEDVNKIIRSIKEHGFAVPFFVWKNPDGVNYVLDGHGRLMALHKLQDEGEELPPLPVVYVDAKTEDEAKNLLLKICSQYGQMTTESVMDFLDGLELNFDDVALPDTLLDFHIQDEDEEDEEDEIPEVEEEAISEPGEMYELGDSLLYCGDSTNEEDIRRLLDGQPADLVFTDPPYGMKKEADGVANDNLNFDDLLDFNKIWIPLALKYLKDNGSFYCWGIDEPLMDIYAHIVRPLKASGEITFRNLITWDKGSGQGQLSEDFRMYPDADEKCIFFMKGVQSFNTNQDNYFEGWESLREYFEALVKALNMSDDKIAKLLGYSCGRTVNHWYSRSQWTFPTKENYNNLIKLVQEHAPGFQFKDFREVFDEYEELKKEYDRIKADFYGTRAYFNNTHDNQNNVWHFAKTSGSEREDAGGHATPKPLKLCERAILSSSREGETVLDLFGGSGSTLIACENLGRRARLIELEPKWCDVIRRRWTKWAKENGRELTSGALE